MTSPADIIATALQVSQQRASAIFQAVRDLAVQSEAQRVTIRGVTAKTGEPREVIEESLVALMLRNVIRARYVPYHRRCDQAIGPDEESKDEVERKAENEEYGDLCRYCGDYLDGAGAIEIRVLFSLASEWCGP